MSATLRVGTRNSLLARTQTEWAVDAIVKKNPGLHVDTVPISTLGDRDQNTSLSKIGSVGIFTKELDTALLDKRVDFAIHSLKDLPTDTHNDLVISAIPKREDPRDALISTKGNRVLDLSANATVGTSSLRRQAQLLAIRNDLTIVDLRGNLDSRMAKATSGELDAIVVACAGLIRLGRKDDITQAIPFDQMLPAVSQGALAIVTRKEDDEARQAVGVLDHTPTRLAVNAERMLLLELGGGCQVPIGALVTISDSGKATLRSIVASCDGVTVLRSQASGPSEELNTMVRQVAKELRDAGADKILSDFT